MTKEFDYQQTLNWLQDYLREHFDVSLQDPEVEIETFGLDSVEKINICAALARHLRIDVDPGLLLDCETCAEFVNAAVALRNGSAVQPPLRAPVQAAVSDTGANYAYTQFVNPYLAEKLFKIRLDKQFVSAEGCYLYDNNGNQYLDFMAQYGALPFGHNPAPIWQALARVEAQREPNFVQPSLLGAAGELAAKLLQHAPEASAYVTFTNSGAESIEAAIKLARSATGRAAILSTHGGFHGKTLGALSASGKWDYQRYFHLNLEGFSRVPFGDYAALERELCTHPGKYAAFIVEPIQGEGGVIMPPPEYLPQVQTICREAGVLLVVDEVQTGIGRVGEVFLSSALGLQPDILVTAKALGGGLVPIGAVISTAAVYNPNFALKHSSTFAGNTLAARAGLATLEWLERDNGVLLQQVKANGDYLLAQLATLQRRYPALIKTVRGAGYLIGVELAVAGQGNYNFIAVAAKVGELAQLFASYLLNVERVRVVPTLNSGNVVRIEPPLTATRTECEHFLTAFARAAAAFAALNTGSIYQSILDGKRRLPQNPQRKTVVSGDFSAPVDHYFAFLLHPLDAESYRTFDGTLSGLSGAELNAFADTMDGLVDPFVASQVVVSANGSVARGELILVNHTADSLKKMPGHEALAVLREAVSLARQRGNKLVGLGAYTSVLSQAGLALTGEGIPLTSGNAYTVVSAMESLCLVMAHLDRSWADSCAAVVGAGGSIGRSSGMLLAERVGALVLVGNPRRLETDARKQLLRIAAEICVHLCTEIEAGRQFAPGTIGETLQRLPRRPDSRDSLESFVWIAEILERNYGCFVLSVNPESIGAADIVVTATSFPGRSFDDSHLKANAIVCDISRPRSIDPDIGVRRPDVLVVDGGVVDVPGAPDLTPYGLPHGKTYACMAETMILALAGEYEASTPGPALEIAYIKKVAALGRHFGFKTAEVQSFGRTICLDDWVCAPGVGVEPNSGRQAHANIAPVA